MNAPNNSLDRSAHSRASMRETMLLLRFAAPGQFGRWAALLKGFLMAVNSL